MTTEYQTKTLPANSENLKLVEDKILQVVGSTKYELSGEMPEFKDPKSAPNVSKRTVKRVMRSMTIFLRRPTTYSANRFLRRYAKAWGLKPVQLRPSKQEQEIQKARKEWKTAQLKSDQLLANYKQAKGSFYK